MSRQEVQFSIQEAGCLIYVTDRSVLEGTAGAGPIFGGELYQDDGYDVRVILGELSPEEQAGWTSKLAGEVELPSGQMIVAGILDPDFDRWLAEFGEESLQRGGDDGDHELGCIVALEPGRYTVEILGYPPNDLAGGWMRIEDRETFEAGGGEAIDDAADEHPGESAQEYFERTRPGEPVPEWISEGYEDAGFLDFVIQVERIGDADVAAATAAGQRVTEWTMRKPTTCPLGIRL